MQSLCSPTGRTDRHHAFPSSPFLWGQHDGSVNCTDPSSRLVARLVTPPAYRSPASPSGKPGTPGAMRMPVTGGATGPRHLLHNRTRRVTDGDHYHRVIVDEALAVLAHLWVAIDGDGAEEGAGRIGEELGGGEMGASLGIGFPGAHVGRYELHPLPSPLGSAERPTTRTHLRQSEREREPAEHRGPAGWPWPSSRRSRDGRPETPSPGERQPHGNAQG